MKYNSIHCGDCLTILKGFPSDSIDAIITSPPYFKQREYTGIGIGMENSLSSYIDALSETFSELIRVIKPTGNILYNIGDKIDKDRGTLLVPYRFAINALESHKSISLLNNITWAKTNPTPRQFNRRLVSSTEPFFHFVKSSKYYYDLSEIMKNKKNKIHNPTSKLGSRYFELIGQSKLSEEEKKDAKKGVERSIEKVHNKEIEGFRVKLRGIHALAFGGGDGGRNIQISKKGFTIIEIKGNPLKTDCIISSVESIKGTEHPAVFPLKLIGEFVKLTCPVNGVVLDPYSGSGTTLLASKALNRNYIGIDINPKYCNYAKKRLG